MDVLTYWVINNLYIYLCKNFLNMLQSVTSFSGVISVGAVCSGYSFLFQCLQWASYLYGWVFFKCRNRESSCKYLLYENDSYLEICEQNYPQLLGKTKKKVPANIYSMKRTAIWKYLNRTLPSCWTKPKTEGSTTIHTEMVGFFGASAASDHCRLLTRNGSVHHELIRRHHGRPRSAIRCCSSTARGRTRDYYCQVLGIAIHSTPQQIKEAYRKLQKQHHPDIAGYKVHHPFLSSSSLPSALLPFIVWVLPKKRTAAGFILTASNIKSVRFSEAKKQNVLGSECAGPRLHAAAERGVQGSDAGCFQFQARRWKGQE